jgi:hypothetical protein
MWIGAVLLGIVLLISSPLSVSESMTNFVKYSSSDDLAKHLVQIVSLISKQFIQPNGIFNIGVSGGSIPALMKGFIFLIFSLIISRALTT